MGEMADMIIDGTVCEECGAFLDGAMPGYPRKCSDCGGDINVDAPDIDRQREKNGWKEGK